MSMTRRDAIKFAEHAVNMTDIPEVKDFYRLASAALRPVTREQVEKVFSGCPACNDRRCTSCRCFGWYEEVCRKCENQSGYQPLKFCPYCGKPLRDEAVEMVMERLEALE